MRYNTPIQLIKEVLCAHSTVDRNQELELVAHVGLGLELHALVLYPGAVATGSICEAATS